MYREFYIITQVILAFWLVLAYDPLEDRGTINVIFTEFLPLCFEMAESFENYGPGQKIAYKKSPAEALNRFEKQEEERQSRFFGK